MSDPIVPIGRLAFILLALVVFAACGGDAASPTPSDSSIFPAGLSQITFTDGSGEEVELLVEIAENAQERTRGLMFRESLPEDQGMLFVFEQDANHSFWMKDTTIPLSIAFIEAGGDIIGIRDMQPLDQTLLSPGAPYRYAVEVNQGWFERNDITVGSTVLIADTTPAALPTPTP